MKDAPRPYQLVAVTGTLAAYQSGKRSAMVVMATGLGKSVTLALLANQYIEQGKRVLILAHRERLIRQLARTIKRWCKVDPDIEMAAERAVETLMGKSPVVIGTIQTQGAGTPPRRERFDPTEFGLIIVDETHRAISKQYLDTLNYYMDGNPECHLFGVTATPDRGDGRAMGMLFECVPFSMDIQDGIEHGWLVPIVSVSREVKSLSLAHIKKVRGDLDAKVLAERLEQEKPTQEITRAIMAVLQEQLGDCKQTIVFTHRVAHAKMVEGTIQRVPEFESWPRVIHGKTPDAERDQIYADFDDKRFPILLNCEVLTEGYDCPEIRCVVVAKPTMARGRFVQMVGRGLRPLPGVIDHLGEATPEERRAAIAASDKPSCLVVVIQGHGNAHNLIAPEDLLGGRYANPEVTKRAKKKARDGQARNVDELLAEAAAEIAEEERRRQERGLLAQGQVDNRFLNLFGGFDPSDPEYGKRLRQLEILHKAKVPPKVIQKLPPEEVKRLSGEIVRRWKKGLCSYWQARRLRENGIDPVEMSYEQARVLIDQIKRGEPVGVGA